MQLLLHGLFAFFLGGPQLLARGAPPLLARGEATSQQKELVEDTFCAVQAFAASRPLQAVSSPAAREVCDIVLNPPEAARTYSTRWGNDEYHVLSMLDSAQAWSAATNTPGQWMQIDLGSAKLVGGVVTQGRNLSSPYSPGHAQYVTEYTLSTATDPSSFQQQGGVYVGNYDNKASVNGLFPDPVVAQYVRIYPLAWHRHISMRAGVLGCPPTPAPTLVPTGSPTASPTVAAPTAAPTQAPTAPLAELHECSVEVNPPEDARTYSTRWGNDEYHVLSMLDSAQAWSAATNTPGQWMQIDLGSAMMVGGVVTQGRNLSSPYSPGHAQYVTEYTVSTATDPSSFQQQGGEYIGNYDNVARVGNQFPAPVLAQYVRIFPTAWSRHISMRAGALTCPPTPSPTPSPTESPTGSPTRSPTIAAPTLSPTAPPSPANPVTSFGDPHVANIMNEKFDILRSGVFTFLAIPRGSSSDRSDLHVLATVEGVGPTCSGKLYVSGLNFQGQWLEKVGAINIMTNITSEEPKDGVVLQVGSSPTRELSVAAFREEVPSSLAEITEFQVPRPERLNEKVTPMLIKLTLGPAVIKVRRVLQAEKIGYSSSLWFACSTLAGIQSEIGGLLGKDDHTLAETVPEVCQESSARRVTRQQHLIWEEQLRLNSEVHASFLLPSDADWS